MKQKAIVVSGRTGADDLNTYLADGWTIVQTCPMPSSIGGSSSVTTTFVPTCLVIIQK